MNIDTSIIIAILSFMGTVGLGLMQLRLWKGQALKNSAEAEAIDADAHEKEKLNDFNILRDINKELKLYIDELRARIKELEEINKKNCERILELEDLLRKCESKTKKPPAK